MKIMVSGSHGLVGTALVNHFSKEAHEVIRIGRDFSKPVDFEEVDGVVHLAGESIADGRWNAAKKERIESSRVDGTSLLAKQISKAKTKPGVFISASAIGYYGDRRVEELTETSQPGTGFLPEVCAKWEEATAPAQQAGVRTVFLRTGIVLSQEGGALKKMLPPFKMGAGGILGDGKQYMSWISLADMVGTINFLIQQEACSGAYNLVSPNPVTNHEFTKVLGNVLHRPTIMPLPAFAARLMFGEMADALLLSSTKVLPKKLLEAGYKFKHADLKPALEEILK